MPNDIQPAPASTEARLRRHESENPPIGGILFAAGLVALTVVACLLIIRVMMGFLTKNLPFTQTAKEPGTIAAPSLKPLQRFPAPNLQIDPRKDLEALRAREDEKLKTYGWIDPKSGIVRIPIERAMDLISQRGLPARSTNGAAQAGESSLELIRERPQKR